MSQYNISKTVSRAAERFYVVLLEGDYDANHYEEHIHALARSAPESIIASTPRWHEIMEWLDAHDDKPHWLEPEEVGWAWDEDDMAAIAIEYLETFSPDAYIDIDMECLGLALELTYLCDEAVVDELLGAIESALDSLDKSEPI